LLIGGGYGVAPLLFLARRALALGYHVSVIIGARRSQDLLLVPAFESLDVSLWLTTEDGSTGLKGRVTDAISSALAGSSEKPKAVYACGPTGMLEAIAACCAAEAISMQLSWEAHMRCGLGLWAVARSARAGSPASTGRCSPLIHRNDHRPGAECRKEALAEVCFGLLPSFLGFS
jgi:dihydroorotate dehydrogenase electron transfer subunit